MSSNATDNVIIPEDLERMCAMVSYVDPESRNLFPPDEVADIVNSGSREIEDVQYLQEWMTNRELLWDKAEQVLEALGEFAEGDVPEWILKPWAIPLGSRWGSGLVNAVAEAQTWLAEKST
jgi:hypothetical protein